MKLVTDSISLSTRGDADIIDITPQVSALLGKHGFTHGQALVFVSGSTAGVTTIEYEPGLLKDIPAMFEKIAPQNARYHHEETWHDGNGHSHVRAALLDVFGNRTVSNGGRGFFHEDNHTFGEGIYPSKIIALAQAVPGVECVRVIRLNRLYQRPNGELENGILPLSNYEIAQLDNDPNYPERGKLEIIVQGGR